MKKIISIILAVLILSSALCAQAKTSAVVSSEDIVIPIGETILIPVNISNNPGIMGFRITVNYTGSLLEILSVTKGDITAKGNFNENVGKNKGEFSVVWNSTQNITADGSLFFISLKAKENFLEKTTVSLSYSQEDTFDEKYKDVLLDCKDFSVSLDDTGISEVLTSAKSNKNNSKSELEDSQLITAVKVALNNYNCTSIYNVAEGTKTDFVDNVNKNIKLMTGSKENIYKSFDDLEKDYVKTYKSILVNNIKENVEDDKIDSALDNALKKVDASSINNVKKDREEAFINEFFNSISEYYSDISDISNDINNDEALKVISKLTNSKSLYIWIFAVVGFVLVIALLLILIKKWRKK